MKATVILIMKEGKVLLARKVKKIGAGMWNGYGGKSEPSDQSLRHTACRELYEESGMGIIVEPEDLVEVANYDEMLPADRDFMPVIISNIRQVNTDHLETPITNGRVLFSPDMKSVVKSEYSR